MSDPALMLQPTFLKNLPAPVQFVLRPWLFVSLILHGVVLVLPILPNQPEPLPPPEERVSLTPIAPTPQRTPRSRPQVTPQPTPSAVTAPRPASQPIVQMPVTRPMVPQPTVQRPNVQQPVIQPSPTPSPVATSTPTPTPSASPASVVPTPEATPAAPSETPTALETELDQRVQTVANTPESPKAEDEISFPHVEGATQGCASREDCWQTDDTQWRSLARGLEESLAAQGYSTEVLALNLDTGVRVYAVAKDEAVEYYLSVVSTPSGTRYLKTDEPMTEDELRQLMAGMP
ncbi:hypothetical protein ACQ4M4_15375 [Leptolyngbya sp. AN02str]|uniref:hypothetical protein n=1 Tax=Leptolyngbya sp. AN02str TaxID=3423363 RepID=UPI003D32255A